MLLLFYLIEENASPNQKPNYVLTILTSTDLIIPATAQIIKDIPGEPTFFKTTTGEINIPDPITFPVMWAAPSNIPNFLGNLVTIASSLLSHMSSFLSWGTTGY